MKFTSYGLSLLSVVLLPLRASAAPWPFTPTLLQKVDLSLDESGTNDQLFALAKAGNINIVADASEFAQFPRTSTVAEHISLLAAVIDISNEQTLGWRNDDERTFLFWSAPDVLTLATDLLHDQELNALIAVPPQQSAKVTVPTKAPQTIQEKGKAYQDERLRKLWPEAPLKAQLAQCLHDQYAWDGQNANLSVSFKFSQLPPELQTQVKPLIIRQIRGSEFIDRGAAWFEPDLWRTATVHSKLNSIGQTPMIAVISTLNGEAVEGQTKLEPAPHRSAEEDAKADAQALAQVEAQPPLKIKTPLLEEVTPEGLAKDARFLLPVSLQLKEQPLPQVLAQLQKQSGLNLAFSAGASAALSSKSVTLSVREMPLGQLMSALTHLYGANWKAGNGGYILNNGYLSRAREELLRAGNLRWFRHYQNPFLQPNAPRRLTLEEVPNWKKEFSQHGFFDAISSPEGVAFADLPADLQLKLRTNRQTKAAFYLLNDYGKFVALEQDLTLRTSPSSRAYADGKLLPPALRLAAIADDGTQLYDIELEPRSIAIGQYLLKQDEQDNAGR